MIDPARLHDLLDRVAPQRLLDFNAGELNGPLGTRHDSIVAGIYPPSWLRELLREGAQL